MTPNEIIITPIQASWLRNNTLDVLRLDLLHPVVSGNKWFKLNYYLQDAAISKKGAIATFGGAWSNHIVATAFACKVAGLKSVGFIRGEKPSKLPESLQNAIEYGMDIFYVSRQEYKNKQEIINSYSSENWYWINEGGFGIQGALGASEIFSLADLKKITHIILPVGTGTTLAGLLLKAEKQQKIIGISSMKGNYSLSNEINELVDGKNIQATFEVIHDYHFGGYGKHPVQLLNFLNETYVEHALPLDIVYTGKTFYAIKDLIAKDYFPDGSNLLMIHTGGIQGNRSLAAKVLSF